MTPAPAQQPSPIEIPQSCGHPQLVSVPLQIPSLQLAKEHPGQTPISAVTQQPSLQLTTLPQSELQEQPSSTNKVLSPQVPFPHRLTPVEQIPLLQVKLPQHCAEDVQLSPLFRQVDAPPQT